MINKTRLIKLTQKVVRIPSENPPGMEAKLAAFIKKDMQSLGLSVKTYSYAKGRPNIVVTLKGCASRKIAQREALLLSPHIDTVPAGRRWKYDPFGGKIRNGKIYGRGTTDDKGNLACAMEAIRSIVEDKVKLKKDIILAATVDEETGSKFGIVPLIDKNILKPKIAVILDSDEFDTIIAQKGLIHLKIKILGKKAHGAYNWRGVNAIEIASRVIDRLKSHKFKFRKHRLLREPTINIGTIQGGDRVNIVADYCEFTVDVRFLPRMSPQSMLKEIKNIIHKESKRFKIEIDNIQKPYEMDPKNPFVQAYLRTVKSFGRKAHLKGSEGATVITFFQNKRIPAFATGFGAHSTAHTTDEYASVSTLYRGAKVLEKFLMEYDKL